MCVRVCSMIYSFYDLWIELFCILSILNLTYSISKHKYVELFDWGPWKSWEKERDSKNRKPALFRRLGFRDKLSRVSQCHIRIFSSWDWSIVQTCWSYLSPLSCFSWGCRRWTETLQKEYRTWFHSCDCRTSHHRSKIADRWQKYTDRWYRTCF